MLEQGSGSAGTSDFAHVDDAASPKGYIHFLEHMRRDPVIAGLKARSHALLAPRDGMRILEVACGLGDDVREMARLAAPTGKVIGLDNSQAMLAEARTRSTGSLLGEEFVFGDMHHLPFARGSFDACRAERVLVHTPTPEVAVAEMVRVLLPGGTLALLEPDLETHIVALDDLALSRVWTRCRADALPSAAIGRHLPVLLQQMGCEDIQVVPAVQPLRQINRRRFSRQVGRALERGSLSEAQAHALIDEVTRRLDQEAFFQYTVFFLVAGRKPAS